LGKAPLRAVLYARVSTRNGEQDPDVQIERLREWAAQRGWQVVAVERDRVSGDPARRRGDPAGLTRAIQAIAERRADVLAVFAADRLVRSPVHLLQLVSRVQSVGGHVASMQDGNDLDTTSDVGELFVFLRGWYARMEMKLIRARIKAGLDRARAEGKTLGRPRTDGPSPRDVRKLRKAGKSWSAIAAKLETTVKIARNRAAEGARR